MENNQMSYEEEQQYIKQCAKEKGIFYITELNTYSATILIEQTHPINIVEDTTDLHGRYEQHIEHGELSYIIGEIMYIYNKTAVGQYYGYDVMGKKSHSHDFMGVMQDCINYISFEITQEDMEYYSKQELEILELIVNGETAEKIIPKFTYEIEGKEKVTYGFENLLNKILNNYETFKPTNTEYYYNKNQLEIIEALIEYQTYEHNK